MATAPTITVYDVYGNVLDVLRVLQGSTITEDRTQAVRWSCDLTVADPAATLAPSSGASMLATGSTSGNTIQALAPDATQLGTYVVQVSDTKDSGDQRTVELTGQDESWLLTRPQLVDAWAVGAGTPWVWAFADLIDYYRPGTDLTNLANVMWPTPAIALNPGDSPWTDMVSQWAVSIGYELYYGADGKAYLSAVPDPRSQVPVANFVASDPSSTSYPIVTVEHEFDDNSAPNAWRRDGVGPGNNVITAIVYDDNPNSSSYVRGGYGLVQDYQQDTLISSQVQANNAATCQLYLGLGANEPVIITIAVGEGFDPYGLRVGDVVTVTREEAGLFNALVVVDTIVRSFYPGDTTQITGRRIWPYL